MGRRNRECYLCGEDYQYCPTCSQDNMKPVWMSDFHSENCKNIFDICTRFNMQLMSKTEAQDALNACDLSNKENFKSYVKRDLEVIFAEDPIVVTLDAEIKEIHEDKAVVETSIRGNKVKKPIQHEVVIKKENE
jgi:hypothetical protein